MFNGSGLFLINSTGQPVSASTLIESAIFNALTADLAAGLSNCVTKDGQTTVIANLPMSGFRFTGLGAGVSAADSARMDQVQSGKANWIAAQGTADAITAAYAPAITTLIDGQLCFFRASAANATTTPTFSPNGLTARTIVKQGGAALLAGDIPGADAEVMLRYNLADTRWELMNPVYSAAADIQAQTFTAFTTGGTDTAFTLTPTPAITAYAANQEWDVVFSAACGAAPTFQVSGLATPPNLVKQNADGTYSNLAAGDFPSGWTSKVKMVNTTQALVRSLPLNAYKEIQPIAASVAANALTVTLNPTTLDFRSTTLGSGAVNTRTVLSPISLTISSGSTLGTVSGWPSRIVILAIDNAGTVELAAVNIAGGVNLDETTLINTVAEGGAGGADSATVVYSQSARTNVPFRVVGIVESTQATAGTWATAPSLVQGMGGQAVAAMSSLGYGQKWQDVTASRALSTTYYNVTGGKPIAVKVYITLGTGGSINTVVDGVTCDTFFVSNTVGITASFIVPPGSSYLVTSTNAIVRWVELR